MSYKVNFLDNQIVTADNMNSIAEALGDGTLAFNDDMTYGVDDLNAISGNLIHKGVSWGCGLSVVDGNVIIGAGVLFMEDGKRVEIDSDGILLPYVSGEKCYVWFRHDTVMGFVAPQCTVTEPAGDDYVVLGEVTASGTISGYAERAVMKNSHLGLNFYEEHTLDLAMNVSDTTEVLINEILLEKVGCRFLIVVSDEAKNSYRYNCFNGYVNLETGKSFGIHKTTPSTVSTFDWGVAYSSESEGKLQVGFGGVSGSIYKIYLRFSLDSDNVLRIYRTSMRSSVSDGYNLLSRQQVKLILC